MKKSLIFLATAVLLMSFISKDSFVSPNSEQIVPKTFYFGFKKQCSNGNPVAVDSLVCTWDGTRWMYNIKYCSAPFTTKTRKISFRFFFLDDMGKEIPTMSGGRGKSLSDGKAYSGRAQGAMSLGTSPHYMNFEVYYQDTEDHEGDGKTTLVERDPSGNTVTSRPMSTDPEYWVQGCTINLAEWYKTFKK